MLELTEEYKIIPSSAAIAPVPIVHERLQACYQEHIDIAKLDIM